MYTSDMKFNWYKPSEKEPPKNELFWYYDIWGNMRIGIFLFDASGSYALHYLNTYGSYRVKDGEMILWAEFPTKTQVVKKLFISQPMSGRTIEDIECERKAIIEAVQNEYSDYLWVVLDSFNQEALGNDKPVEELGKCVSIMQDADLVAFSPDWLKSSGCAIEHQVASIYKIPSVHLDDTYQIQDSWVSVD